MDAKVFERLLNETDDSPAARVKAAAAKVLRDARDRQRQRTLSLVAEKIPGSVQSDALSFATMIDDETVRFDIPGIKPFIAKEDHFGMWFYPARIGWFNRLRVSWHDWTGDFDEIVRRQS